MFKMKYWERLLVNDKRRMSVWLIMLDRKVKWREERWMLMYAVTLGGVALFMGLITKSNQFGWWTVPTKFLPLLLEVLGTLRIMDHGGSWIKIISKSDCVSRMVLMIRWFSGHSEKNFEALQNHIFYLLLSEERIDLILFHGFQRILSGAILCWSSAFRMGIG